MRSKRGLCPLRSRNLTYRAFVAESANRCGLTVGPREARRISLNAAVAGVVVETAIENSLVKRCRSPYFFGFSLAVL